MKYHILDSRSIPYWCAVTKGTGQDSLKGRKIAHRPQRCPVGICCYILDGVCQLYMCKKKRLPLSAHQRMHAVLHFDGEFRTGGLV